MRGIPVLQPIPLVTDPLGPLGASQPILQFKELVVDAVRYQAWKAALLRDDARRVERALRAKGER